MKSWGFVELDHLCECASRPLPVGRALSDLAEECLEFLRTPWKPHGVWLAVCEEFSDMAYCVGKLIGAIARRTYFRVPGDSAALWKIRFRVFSSGCIRSLRHRAPNTCATSGKMEVRIRCSRCQKTSAPFVGFFMKATYIAPCAQCGSFAIHHMEIVRAKDQGREA